MVSLLSLSCVNADDSNGTDMALELTDNVSQESNLELSDDNEDVLEITADENVLETAADEDILSSNESNGKTDSSAYLILDNDANIENVYVGDYVVWIVSVINKGPDIAKNVKVYDQLPDGMEYIKHTATKGTFNPKTGIWNIGNLSAEDGEVFLNITVKALSVGEKINKANLTTDSINLNNESYEEEEIDVLEPEDDDNDSDMVAKSLYSTGNPLALVLISLFIIFVTSIKSKE
ncbi:MAG: DUF11 domain-containing protein [Methanobrevibacter sp.]|uniref:DUF11 domain-containing protein n=1 Tax=Methanobrevibacter sp. TaxID=66852 RepID=UPI0025DD5F83|nr:DUF11 domain-containing protein [Methanobrevibacter sp.]MBR3113753.1 DUF11 domain-containing protein [Methanobrevibacter sp.]